MPQVPILLRHPEVPAHHTTALAACTCARGPRRMAAPHSLLAPILHRPGRRPSRLARPKRPGSRLRVTGGSGSPAAPASTVNLIEKRSKTDHDIEDVDGRDNSAFTRVFDALCPAMTSRGLV